MTGPIVRLANLSPEDLYVLLGKIRHVYAAGDSASDPIPDEALKAFMQHCSQRIGEAYFRTPRNTIKEFVNLLAVLDQNPRSVLAAARRNGRDPRREQFRSRSDRRIRRR